MTKTKEAAISQTEFLSLGIHYYLVGRFAALGHLMPVAGNLLHHSIEMLLKGALSEWLSFKRLKDLGHNLPKLWQEYKKREDTSELGKVEWAIDKLDKFEAIRYPDGYLRNGAEITLKIHRAEPNFFGSEGIPTIHSYELALEDVDEAMMLLFRKLRINPDFFTAGLTEDVKRYLALENLHPLARQGDGDRSAK